MNLNGHYLNWMPAGLVRLCAVTALGCFALAGLGGYFTYRIYLQSGTVSVWRILPSVLSAALGAGAFGAWKRFRYMRRNFDFAARDSLSMRILNFICQAVELSPGAVVLDVGCGSGALTNLFAKTHPDCKVIGVDIWSRGRNVYGFSKSQCEENAETEGLSNVSFRYGDAKKLPFEDGSFDAIISNYVYHNIRGNKHDMLDESFRVLKKGGCFALHDLFALFVFRHFTHYISILKKHGFERVELLDTTKGSPITKHEARKTMLKGSRLLTGIK